MPLLVYTATLRCRDDDVLNVTRGSGGVAGAPFAPSSGLLEWYQWQKRRDAANPRVWALYVASYRAEMVTSQRAHAAAWTTLLARPRVVLCCYCPPGTRCHRRLLAAILAERGANDEGEIEL